ncbi:MAG: deoxyribodipyrimidine photo-lyase, partial [Flammeovirgaceae bacterium]
MSPSHTSLVWFRNDLRIADNHSLLHAIKSPHQVIGLYCFDPRHFAETSFGFRKTEKFRAKFLLETVAGLKQNLEQLGIPLLVYVAQPENVIPRLVGQYHIKQVFSQKEWTSEEETVYQNVKAAVPPKILFHEVYDQFLYHPADVPFEVQKLPNVFTNFRKKCEKYASVKSIESLPQIEQKPISNPTTLPTLPDLGFQEFQVDRRTAFPFKGGENEALARLESYFFETQKLAYYKKTRNGLLGTDYSS